MTCSKIHVVVNLHCILLYVSSATIRVWCLISCLESHQKLWCMARLWTGNMLWNYKSRRFATYLGRAVFPLPKISYFLKWLILCLIGSMLLMCCTAGFPHEQRANTCLLRGLLQSTPSLAQTLLKPIPSHLSRTVGWGIPAVLSIKVQLPWLCWLCKSHLSPSFPKFHLTHPASLQDCSQSVPLGLGMSLGTVVIFPAASSCACIVELCDHFQIQSQLHSLTLSIYI